MTTLKDHERQTCERIAQRMGGTFVVDGRAKTMTEVKVEQIDRDAAAKALGYSTWEDATDYRNSGEEDRRVAHMVQAFARHRIAASQHDKLVEALTKAQAVFAEYAELHRRKLGGALPPFMVEDIRRKVARNRDMSDMCLAALKNYQSGKAD